MPTLFQSLAELCEKLESTKKRNEMVRWVAEFVRGLESDEIASATSMLLGRAFPRWDQRVLEVSWATLSKTIRSIANVDRTTYSYAFNKTGDAGDAVKIILEQGKIRKQATLFQKRLTILEVQRTFETIAESIGVGSKEKKERLLKTLFGCATSLEAKYIVKVLIGEMRTGFSEGLMELAVAQAFTVPIKAVRTASMLMGELGEVAALAKAKGKEGLLKLGFTLFRPIKPMLAQTAEDQCSGSYPQERTGHAGPDAEGDRQGEPLCHQCRTE